MFTFPTEITTVIAPFGPLFSEAVWYYAQILLIGSILAPGKRTVSAVLYVLGQKDDAPYQSEQDIVGLTGGDIGCGGRAGGHWGG